MIADPTFIELVPVGVEKDPGRVNKAVSAFESANAAARDALWDLLKEAEIQTWENGYISIRGRKVSVGNDVVELVKDAQAALRQCAETQEEMLRAVAGAPPQKKPPAEGCDEIVEWGNHQFRCPSPEAARTLIAGVNEALDDGRIDTPNGWVTINDLAVQLGCHRIGS